MVTEGTEGWGDPFLGLIQDGGQGTMDATERQNFRERLAQLKAEGKTIDSKGNEISLKDEGAQTQWLLRQIEIERADEKEGVGQFTPEAYGVTTEKEGYVFGAETIDPATKKHLDSENVFSFAVIDAQYSIFFC